MNNAEVAPDEALEEELLNDPLTLAVMGARSGLRSDVAALVEVLNEAEFWVRWPPTCPMYPRASG